jgi:hypothetical protein
MPPTNLANALARPVFWGEIAPCDHFVQFYEDEAPFLDTLAGFIGGGLVAGESAVVIATAEHRAALDARLRASDVDVDSARAADRYVVLDAAETLERFMVGHWPDDERFHAVVAEILGRARANGTNVRAFGEMVAVLWARGDHAATVRLEHLWQALCRDHADGFSLFCAYPKAGFTKNAASSMRELCDAHSRVLA